TIGFNLTFFPMHVQGLMGMARRTYTYPDLPGWGALNFIETIGAFTMGVAVLLLLWDVLRALRVGVPAGNNPWNAWTLEWATTSPPPPETFVALPPITSPRPLYQGGGVPMGAGHAIEHGATTADLTRNWKAPIVGIAAFIFSEITFFGALIVA